MKAVVRSKRDHLHVITTALARNLPALCQGLGATAHSSVAVAAGDLRNRRVIVRGIERAEPRELRLDDDPGLVDVTRLPPLVGEDFAGCWVRGELRAKRFVRTTESELVVIADLSRSVLSGLFDIPDEKLAAWGEPGASTLLAKLPESYTAAPKVCALFFAVASFLGLGSRVGFRLRTICTRGDRAEEQRGGRPSDLIESTLSRMGRLLVEGYERAEKLPTSTEPFGLVAGLRTAQAVRMRGVVLVVSDFLDPVALYGPALRELMVRHHVVLADVSHKDERGEFPVPGYLNFASKRVPYREGARHLEKGVDPSPIPRERAREWNEEQKHNRAQLALLARRSAAPYLYFHGSDGRRGDGRTFAQSYEMAMRCVRQMH